MNQNLANEVNALFEKLEREVEDKKVRKSLEKLNKELADLGDESNGEFTVQRVNWNS